jgi:hypothetical protein
MNGPHCLLRALPVLLAASLLLAAGPAAATLYKWTDANGRVVYSDQPPAGNIKSEIVQGPPPPANAAAVKELTKQEGEFKKRQLDAAENTKKSLELRTEQVKRNEMCTRALGQTRTLAAEDVPLVRKNEKGEDVFVDNAVRRRERAELDIWIKANCTAG